MLVRLRQAGIGNRRTLRAEELAGDVEGLAADDDDLLAVEELLGDDAGEATEEVALAVNDDLREVACQQPVSPSSQVPAGSIPGPMVAWASSRLLCVGGRRRASRDRGGGMHWNHQKWDNTYHLLERRHLSRCLLGRKGE